MLKAVCPHSDNYLEAWANLPLILKRTYTAADF